MWCVASFALLIAAPLVAAPAAPTPEGIDPALRTYLEEIRTLTAEALAASRAAEAAATAEEVKRHADRVVELIWGLPSGMADGARTPAEHGWKTHWQTTGAEFDSAWVARYGTKPPAITDPSRLGIAGRARHVREALVEAAGVDNFTRLEDPAARGIAFSLSNLIGYMHLTHGYKGREVQPRISLTHVWNQPKHFFHSTSDTGWLFEAQAQAYNILKTDYEGDAEMARRHAAALTELLQKVADGVDADGDGTVEPDMMEGGVAAALALAE